MNVFYLDADPVKAAEYHCDKHVVKMIVEYAQILFTNQRLMFDKFSEPVKGHEYNGTQRIYKRGPKSRRMLYTDKVIDGILHTQFPMDCFHNHPSTQWTRLSANNYEWLLLCFMTLLEEFEKRYNKQHSMQRLVPGAVAGLELFNYTGFQDLTPEYQAIANVSLKDRNPVVAYRNYYLNEKDHFAKWEKKNNVPYWWKN